MYKWKIEVLLKNGTRIHGVCRGDETTSADVVNNLLGKRNSAHYFFGFMDETETHNIVVNADEVTALDVSVG